MNNPLTVVYQQFGEVGGQKLLDELRAVILKPDYDRMTIATLIGVLELLKDEFMERNK